MSNTLMTKSIVVYYSIFGFTKKLALEEAEKTGADVFEMDTVKPRSFFKALLACPAAAKWKPDKKLKPITVDFADYDEITVAVPLWNKSPAPAFNNALRLIPEDKKVKVIITSAGGESPEAMGKIKRMLRDKKCFLIDYVDVKNDSEVYKRAESDKAAENTFEE